MKCRILVSSILLSFGVAVQAANNPNQINVTFEKAYVPVGFDDNDRSQLMITGVFPDTCYKVGPVERVIDSRRKTVRIWQTAYHYGGTCIEMKIPFSQVVNIGVVEAGTYTIFDGLSGKRQGTLAVGRATRPEADDFLYAPIRDAFVTVEPFGKVLLLKGEFSDRCTELKEVKIHYYQDVIVAQPIALRTEARCEEAKTRFLKTVPLDASLSGNKLLHVRSMNGQAINKLVDLDP